jgi:dTDP-4-dehydrorhamnose 3,5-epimerase
MARSAGGRLVNIKQTPLAGAFLVDLAPSSDERGFFARAFCQDEFAAHGMDIRCAQSNICLNLHKGTVRGMHLQLPPAAEAKLVRCTRGAVYDVIVDLRPESPTFLRHYAAVLSRDNHRALYVPPLFAHGYQVLEDDTELYYQMSEPYAPGFERGFRYDDPRVAIMWPLRPRLMSPKDANLPPVDCVAAELSCAGVLA